MNILVAISHLLIVFNCSLNCFIYCGKDARFRRELLRRIFTATTFPSTTCCAPESAMSQRSLELIASPSVATAFVLPSSAPSPLSPTTPNVTSFVQAPSPISFLPPAAPISPSSLSPTFHIPPSSLPHILFQ